MSTDTAKTRQSRQATGGLPENEADPPALVLPKTEFGGTRIVDLLIGDPLPRICWPCRRWRMVRAATAWVIHSSLVGSPVGADPVEPRAER
ncbi:hypothetical protein KGQ20_40170 [Catenulispora sp. NF23]|nr:hypothetical protein [Catenulispora pinistramenti]MBS2538982.1 hypothetical protein [Catenulispora pinistramenti]